MTEDSKDLQYDREVDIVTQGRQVVEREARAQAARKLEALPHEVLTAPYDPTEGEPFPPIVGALAKRGWAVFPLDGKIPFGGSRGFKDATTDLAQLRRFWTQHPGANWGIATGRTSGIVVLDTDGLAGERALRDLLAGNPPTTLMIETARGSHYYFKYPRNGFPRLAPQALGPKLDTKADGGYVVGPLATHPERLRGRSRSYDRRYEIVWEVDELPELPPAVLIAAELAARKKEPDALPTSIPTGQRNAVLTSIAGTMRRRGASEEAIKAALVVENTARCVPPLSDGEVDAIAHSVGRYLPSRDAERLDDIGNARRFVVRHGTDVRYVAAWNSWLAWDGKRWAPDETGEIERRAKDTVLSIDEAITKESDDTRKKALRSHANRSSSSPRLAAMVSVARSEPEIALTPQDFDTDPWLLNVANGTIDLRSGTLRDHGRDDLLTKLAPIAYDPKAEASRWKQFLGEIFKGVDASEVINFLQRAVGYALSGETSEQCLFFCYGQGANGKSVFLETLVTVLGGDYARTVRFESFLAGQRSAQSASGDLARLQGARLVQASEAPGGRPLDTVILKELTGGDTVTARHLYQREFEFKPQFKIWLRANHRPEVSEQTLAFWRRMHLIPFMETIPPERRDGNLSAKLAAEAAGILAWAVKGCSSWQEVGLQPPEKILRATQAYREENDTIADFILNQGILDPDKWTSSAELYDRFTGWWSRTHSPHERIPERRAFGRSLGERADLREKKCSGVRGWRGIALKPSASY